MIPRVSAKFETTLALKVNIGDETGTLTSVSDADGTAIPNGTYGFTVDEGNNSFEYFEATVTGTALTNVKSFSASELTETVGFTKEHRAGSEVKITDFTILGRLSRIFRGAEGIDPSAPLYYETAPTLSDGKELATVQYVLDNITGGSVTFNSNVITGVAGEAVSSGDWVYLDESDGRWYVTDANEDAKSINVKIGKALGAGTTGNAISGGVFIGGIETSGTYVAGTKYYLSNTAGELSTSPGENSVLVGIGEDNTNLIFVNLYDPESVTQDQKDALAGTLGTPSSTNKYVTDSNATSAGTDQSQTTDDSSVEFGEADATTKKNKIAQSFKPTKNKIRGLRIRKEADTGDFTGTITVAIQEDDGSGDPDGSTLVSGTLDEKFRYAGVNDTVDVEFSSEYSLDTTKTYWAVISASTSDNSNHPNLSANSAGGYADGSLKYNNTTDGWVDISGTDLYFETLEGNKNQKVETDDDGKIALELFDRSKMPVPVIHQTIPFGTSTYTSTALTSETDGSVLYWMQHTSTSQARVERYERNSIGYYNRTHAVTLTLASIEQDTNSYDPIVIGEYLYLVWGNTSGDVAITRLDKADLTNETSMTVPTITFAASGFHTWTDGKFIYYNAENSSTVSKYSISGTTVSLEDTGTADSSIYNINEGGSVVFDGENHWYIVGQSNNIEIFKFNDIYANSVTNTDYSMSGGEYFPQPTYTGTSNVAESRFTGCVADEDYIYLVYVYWYSDNGTNRLHGLTLYPLLKP